jgi:outer membrane cobalamin receptor
MKRKLFIFVLMFAVVLINYSFAEGEAVIDQAKPDAAAATVDVKTTTEAASIIGQAKPEMAAAAADAETGAVVVIASRMPENIAEVTRNIDIITADDIKASGMENITDILNSINGLVIHQTSGYQGTASVYTRGAPSEETLVMIDGIPINDMLSGGADLTMIDTSSVQRIEAIKGGLSSVYGEDSSAGVINVITGANEPGAANGRYGAYDYEYGSFNYQKEALELYNKIAGLTYDVSTVQESSDGYTANSDFTKRSVDLKFDYKSGFIDSIFTGLYFKREMGVPFGPGGPDLTSRQSDENYDFGLNEKFKVGDVNAKVSGYMRSANLGFQDPSSGTDSDNVKKEYEGNAIISYDTGSVLSFETGYESNVKNITATNILGEKSNVNQASLSSITAKLFDDKLMVNGGFRADFNSAYGNMTSENISAKYNLLDIFDIRGLVDKSYSAPTLGDLYWYEVDNYYGTLYYTFGNPNLKTENSTNYELSFSKKISNASGMITFFDNDINNLIEWESTPDYITTTTVNIDKASIMGAEAKTEVTINDYLSVKAGYTYMKAVDAVTKEPLPYRPTNQVNAGVAIVLPSRTRININGQYSDIRYYSNSAAPLKSYYLLNASIAQEITKDINFFLNIDNALNNSQYEIVNNYMMPGRSLNIGMRAGF